MRLVTGRVAFLGINKGLSDSCTRNMIEISVDSADMYMTKILKRQKGDVPVLSSSMEPNEAPPMLLEREWERAWELKESCLL